ncbi:MAG: hypothetical protein Q8L68_02290 [Methylococcales bacterium]|nr:hypothetical protein [Methylococcales bacterium]
MSDKDEVARGILKEARNSQDRFQQYKLLKTALSETVTDKELYSEIREEFGALDQSIKSSLVMSILQLQNKGNYEGFISALRSLEEWIKIGYSFTTSQEAQIVSARKWFDNKRIKDGAGVSKALIGGLRDKYVLYQDVYNTTSDNVKQYYINVDEKLSYEQYLAKFSKDWKDESKNSCGKVLISAGQSARTSPSAARTFLQNIINTEVEYKTEDGRILTIKEYPFDTPETEQIKGYIGNLETACKNERDAETLRVRAFNATNSYAKYELLIEARGHGWSIPLLDGSADGQTFHLPGLDQEIKEIYNIAAEVRNTIIKEKIDGVSKSVSTIQNLGKKTIEEQFSRIEEKLREVLNDTIEWPGEGKVLQLGLDDKNTYMIKRPAELAKAAESYQKIQSEYTELKSVYENILKGAEKEIRELLDDPDLHHKRKGAEEFVKLKNNEKYPVFSRFQIYKDLAIYATEYASFEEDEISIQSSYNAEDWRQVLQIYATTIKKPNFQRKCPSAIKQNILVLKKDATRRLKFQKIQNFVKIDNYFAAKSIWEQPLEDSDADYWQPVKNDIEKIKQVEETGKEILEFHKEILLEFNIPYIFREILHDPEEIFNRLNTLSPSDTKIARGILEKNEGRFFGEEYDAGIIRYLSILLRKFSFEQKAILLEKLNHVAGKSKSSDPRWPAHILSLAQYEARLLSGYISSLLRQETLEYLAGAKNSASELDLTNVGARINSIYKFDFPLNDEEKNILKDVEIKYTQTRAKELSVEQALHVWEVTKKHFEEDTKVSEGYSQAKRNWYLNEVQKLRTKGQFDDALELIAQGLDDEYVGTIWQLYLEKAYTCLDMEEFEDARKALNDVVRRFKRTGEVLKLEVDIELGEKSSRYRGEPLGFMNSLLDYWKTVDKKYRGTVEQSIHKNYETFSQEYKLELKENINGDREQAWRPLLDLMRLEEIYSQVKPQAKRASNDFVELLIPTFYPTGISLIEESENFNQKVMDHGVELKKCLSEGEQLFSRLVSYEGLLSSMLTGQDDDLLLGDVIRNIINKKVRDQRKKDFARELDNYISDYEGSQKRYSEIPVNRSRVRQNLDARLKECEKRLDTANDAATWFECSSAVMLGERQADAWKPLDTFTERLKDYKNFQEVKQFQNALDNWKSTLPDIFREYEALRDYFSEEKFDQAESSSQKLANFFASLLPFSSDDSKHRDIIRQLKSRLTVQNSYNKDDLNGLDAIRDSIADLNNEISLWQKERTQRQNEVGGFNQKIRQFQEKVSRFKGDYYEPHKRLLWSKNAVQFIEDYFGAVSRIVLLKSQDASTTSSYPQPRDIPVNKPSPQSSSQQNNANDGFMSSFFSKKTNVNPLLEGIKSSYETANPIVEQKDEIDGLLSEIETTANNDHISLSVRSLTAEKLKKECGLLISQKQDWTKDLDGVSNKNRICQEEIPYPKKEGRQGFQDFYGKNQYANMARRIIEADLIGSMNQSDRDEVNAFREILMKVRWT